MLGQSNSACARSIPSQKRIVEQREPWPRTSEKVNQHSVKGPFESLQLSYPWVTMYAQPA